MKQLPKKYKHQEAEKKWQQFWEENKVYQWDQSQPRDNTFVIDTPPPTVSGLLHMGHIFSYTQADLIARYQRMSGKTVFYPMGFDDNGLPTERLVEKEKKVRATNMSREDFISLCEGVSDEARKEFKKLFQSVALSVDWEQEYHTISKKSRKISQLSFLDLYNKNRVERKLQPMLWDPVDQTALAQAELEDKERESFENYINFGLISNDDAGKSEKPSWENLGKVEIMTTRPELLGVCVALMCHPDDAYKYTNKFAVTPLFNVIVPIIADEKVQKDKGSGLVMCCTFGDETDIEWWRKYSLPTRVILNKYGKIDFLVTGITKDSVSGKVEAENIISPHNNADGDRGTGCLTIENTFDIPKAIGIFEQIKGLKVTLAKDKMVELLQESGELNERKPIQQTIKVAERSGSALEIIPTNQWFIKILDQKEELKKKAAECNWYPQFMKVRIDQWIDGLSWDWCISRQRYFGVPFPIWYSKRAGEEGKVLLAEADQLPVNPLVDLPKGYSRDEVDPEADVMDTWATSSVSPQLSSHAITEDLAIDSERHSKLFPADLRPQAHEIIRTWAFYTIVKAHLHEDTIPWKNLMISGWCLASDKTKMSKSKGNVVTPVKLIEEKGSDIVRYWASTSHLGSDTAYSEGVLKIGAKLTNKIWNASKFATLHVDKIDGTPTTASGDITKGIICETIDKWIITRLNRTIKKATAEFEKFEYCKARETIEDFFWNDFCDNYLEISKTRAYGELETITNEQQQSAIYTLYHCSEAILKLFAPFVPHITDELYSHIFDDKFEENGSLNSVGQWPDLKGYSIDENSEQAGIFVVDILNAVRKLKAERNVSIKYLLDKLIVSGEQKIELFDSITSDLAFVTNSTTVEWQDSKPETADNCDTHDGIYNVAAIFSETIDAI